MRSATVRALIATVLTVTTCGITACEDPYRSVDLHPDGASGSGPTDITPGASSPRDPGAGGGVGGGALAGTIVRSSDGVGIGPYPVSLFDLERLVAVDQVTSDDNGAFSFEGIQPGFYLPVLTSDEIGLFGLPRSHYEIKTNETFEDLFPVAPLPRQSTGGQPIAGIVVDSETLERIPFARVEMTSLNDGSNWSQLSSNWSEFRGHSTQQEPIANALGEFRIDPTPTLLIPDPLRQGEILRIHPSWRVTAPGFRAKNFSVREQGPGDYNVTVRLERGSDEGTLRGRVIGFDRQARVGVQVAAEWRRAIGEAFKGTGEAELIISQGLGVSDENGEFRIDGLPPGFYNVQAGARGDDGWIGPAAPASAGRPGNNFGGLQAVELGEAGIVDVGDLIVVPTIDLVVPLAGGRYVRSEVMRWTPIEGASRYRVLMRRGIDLASVGFVTNGAELQISTLTPPFDLPALFRLEVVAEDAEGQAVSQTDRPLLLQYEPDRSVGIGN